MPSTQSLSNRSLASDPPRKFRDQMSRFRATTLSRKDWHSGAIGAVLSVNFGRQGRPEILPRRLHRRGGASVVRRDAAKPNGGSQCQSLQRSDRRRQRQPPFQRQNHRDCSDPEPKRADRGSKQSRVIALLQSPTGATIEAMMKATGWQPHSVRGFLAGVVRKRLKLKLGWKKVDGNRVYQIASADRGTPTSRQPNAGQRDSHAAGEDRSCAAGPRENRRRDGAPA